MTPIDFLHADDEFWRPYLQRHPFNPQTYIAIWQTIIIIGSMHLYSHASAIPKDDSCSICLCVVHIPGVSDPNPNHALYIKERQQWTQLNIYALSMMPTIEICLLSTCWRYPYRCWYCSLMILYDHEAEYQQYQRGNDVGDIPSIAYHDQPISNL